MSGHLASPASGIVINGSHGEGGSALLRTALCMASLTTQPVRIHSVRGAMRKQGLMPEDLEVLRALEVSCHAQVHGDELGSSEISFGPTRLPQALNARLDPKDYEQGAVPGNALIVLQTLTPVLARTGAYSKLAAHGETYNPNTLTYDIFERGTLAAYRRLGLYAYPELHSAGFGFGSHGEVSLQIEPSALSGLPWAERGRLVGAHAVVVTAQLRDGIGERGAEHARALLSTLRTEVDTETFEVVAKGPGTYASLFAFFENGLLSAGAMGARGIRIEDVVGRAFQELSGYLGTDATVDPYLADQLLLPAVISEGRTEFKTPVVTARLQTMAWVIKQFLPIHITILGRVSEPGSVAIEP